MALGSEHGRASVKVYRPRLIVAMVLVTLVFVLLVSRLYTLQVLRGDELADKGQRNIVQRLRIPHDRGIIYDRYGRIIVDNRPSLDVLITPAFLGNREEREATLQRLADRIKLAPEDLDRLRREIKKVRPADRFQPIFVKRDIEADQLEAIEADRSVFLLDGVDIVEGRRRTYRYGSLAAHLLGYVGEIDSNTLDQERKRGNPKDYQLGDVLGRGGVERTYEDELRGVDGYEKIVVDAKGRRQHDEYVDQILGAKRREEPKPGHNLVLTIDLDLQHRAEAAFTGRAGAVVALDPNSGAVLAYVSAPAVDPNLMSGALSREELARIRSDPLKPLFNRPIQGQYAPGSTFKVVTAMAALANKAVSPTERVLCPGYYRLGHHTWRCWREAGHGYVDLKTAIKVSCDVYFYTMGARLGLNPIAEMARHMSFGSRTGIALPGEMSGIAPDEAYHNRVDKKWGGYQKGMALNTAIGQGALTVTPLQLAIAYALIANGGTYYRPQIVQRIETADFRVVRRFLPEAVTGKPVPRGANLASSVREEVVGEAPTVLAPWTPEVVDEVHLSDDDLAQVRAGLVAVTQEPGGTAYTRRSLKVTMAGKTGTAQVVTIGSRRLRSSEMSYFERDHAWFASYAPIDKPEIVVVALNEHSGHGGSMAAPIATAVIDAYFELKEARALHASAEPQDAKP